MTDQTKINPIRYSIPILVVLTACLFFGEHFPLADMHATMDLAFTLSKHTSQLPREVAYIVMGTIGVIGIFQAVRVRHEALHWNLRLTIPISLLLGWSALSIFWSDTPAITGKRLFVLGLMFVGGLGVALSWTKTEVLKFMALSAAAQVTIGFVLELANGYFTPWHADYRFAGTLPWNSQGYVCLVCALSSICLAQGKQPLRWIYQVLAGYGVVFLLLTRSRGGLLAFSIAAMLYLVLTLDLRQKVVTTIIVGTIAMTVILSGTGPSVIGLLDRGGEGAENFTGRGPLWEQLITYATQRLWTGYGYEGFWTVERIDDVSSEQHWAPDTAHSAYIEGLLTFGIIGASLHTVVLLVGLFEGVRLFRMTRNFAFFLGASFCCVYLGGGLLESLLIVKLSPTSFYFSILLCQLGLAKRPRDLNRRMKDGALTTSNAWRVSLLNRDILAAGNSVNQVPITRTEAGLGTYSCPN